MTTEQKTEEQAAWVVEDAAPQQLAPVATEAPARRAQVVRDLEPTREARPTAQAVTIMEMSPGGCGDLFAALAAAQGAFGEIERHLTAKIKSERANYEYKYAPLDEVLNAIRPALSANGIALMQFPLTRQGSVLVRTMLAHKSGQWIYNELAASSVGNDPQSVGSVITYLRRYGAQSISGVAPGYDDDGEVGSIRRTPVEELPKATPRKSETAPTPKPEPKPETASATVQQIQTTGRIVEVAEREKDGVVSVRVKLDDGSLGATSDPELVQTAKALKQIQNATVKMTTVPAKDSRYSPVMKAITVCAPSR